MVQQERKNIPAIVEELFSTIAGEAGVELVDVEVKTSQGRLHLLVYIDQPQGITLEDCERVSKLLGELLDMKDPIPSSYMLEVSSPGIERPFKKREDFRRFSGRYVKIKTYRKLDGQKNFKGILVGLEDDRLVVQLENGSEVRIDLGEISKAQLWDKY